MNAFVDLNREVWTCPHCGTKIKARYKRNHLKTVIQMGGRNVCVGLKDHPRFQVNERLRAKPKKTLPIYLPQGWRSPMGSKKSKHG